jgi:hypothetical protein
MERNPTDLDRRDFLRTLAAVGVVAGTLSIESKQAEAASCPKFPKTKKSKDVVPVRIQSEVGDDISGRMDLRTVERSPAGSPPTIAVELIFDQYEEGKCVREHTDKIETLALVHQELHRPPTALLTWGTGLAFKCILESFRTAFALFLDDGTPVRAVMMVRLALDLDDCTLGSDSGTP